MTDFLSMSVWIFDTLVLGFLPLVMVIIFVVYMMRILTVMREKIIAMYQSAQGAFTRLIR
jgi:hypothetical protein